MPGPACCVLLPSRCICRQCDPPTAYTKRLSARIIAANPSVFWRNVLCFKFAFHYVDRNRRISHFVSSVFDVFAHSRDRQAVLLTSHQVQHRRGRHRRPSPVAVLLARTASLACAVYADNKRHSAPPLPAAVVLQPSPSLLVRI